MVKPNESLNVLVCFIVFPGAFLIILFLPKSRLDTANTIFKMSSKGSSTDGRTDLANGKGPKVKLSLPSVEVSLPFFAKGERRPGFSGTKEPFVC